MTVGGRLVVRGGGVNTIYLKNTVTGSIFIEKLSDGGIRIHADDGSPVEFISIADGNDGIVIECDVASLSIAGSDLDVAISGRVENLTVSGNNVTLSGSGSVGAVLLEKGVTGIVILAEYATILNNSGETVAVTGKEARVWPSPPVRLSMQAAAGFIADETDSDPMSLGNSILMAAETSAL